MDTLFNVSASPHIRFHGSVRGIMWAVVVSLTPAWIGAIYFFGLPAVTVTLLAVISAVASDAVCQRIRGRKVAVSDGSAVVTGLLLAFTLPPNVPWWIPVAGSAFAIIIGKQVFGGLGSNPMNPALLGRAFLMASWPLHLTGKWAAPAGGTMSGINAVTNATPLNALKSSIRVLGDGSVASEKLVQAEKVFSQLSDFSIYQDFFLGRTGGCIGETSVLLLLIGAVFLLFIPLIEWRLPLAFIATVSIMGWIFGGLKGSWFAGDPVFHMLSGGLFLGAFFMATDMVTSPLTNRGKLIFGVGCGLITIIIRLKGGYPEGVCYSILLMNLAVPLIDRYTRPRTFGEVKK